MILINDINEALTLLKEHNLISKPYGGKPIMYSLQENKILVVNNNLKTYISLEQFKEDFKNSVFYYMDVDTKENEIIQEHISYRQ